MRKIIQTFPFAFTGPGAVALALGLLLAVPEAGGAILYSVSRQDDQLRSIDPATGGTIGQMTITLPGEIVIGGSGLATHPTTGELWALLRLDRASGSPERELVTINPSTGEARRSGSTGDIFVGMAFGAGGRLFAVTSDQAAVPETLFELDMTDGTAHLQCAFGNGDTGEALGFNTADGFFYHASGANDRVFERVDDPTMDPCSITNVPLSSSVLQRIVGSMTYSPDDGAFFWTQGPASSTEMYLVAADGAATFVGALDHAVKGLAFWEPPTVPTLPPAEVGDLNCYPIRMPPGHRRIRQHLVMVEDGLGTHMMRVGRPVRWCEPTTTTVIDRKSGTEVTRPAAGEPYVCYRMRTAWPPKFRAKRMVVSNDLAQGQDLIVRKPRTLCVPSTRLEAFDLR